ncbi:MAG: TonB-dependent receptor [Acidobacteriota bacterium]
MRKSIFFLASVFVVALTLSTGVFAQRTTGNLEGTVTDPKGAVVPGITVTVSGVTVGFNRTVNTDNQGRYNIQQIPSGTYKVTTSATGGFGASEVTDVRVLVEQTTTLDVKVGISSSVNVVNVSSDPMGVNVDTTDSKIQTNITSQLIDSIPKGGSLTSLLKISPGTRSEPLSGGFQVDGASGSENSFLIDGQEVSNFRTGTLNQNNNIPTSLISEVQVKTSGFEAEHGGASGGVISVVTKGGSNQFRGEFGSTFESQKLQANGRAVDSLFQASGSAPQYTYMIRSPKDQGVNWFPTASFSGPIIKDRVWFLVNHSPQIYDATRSVNFYNPLSSANFPGASSTPGVSGVNLVPSATYAPQKYHGRTYYEYDFARVDAAITNNLRVSGTFLYNPIRYDGLFPYGAIAVGSTPIPVLYAGQTLTSADYSALQGGRTNSNNFTSSATYTPLSNFIINGRFTRGYLNEKGTTAYAIPNATRYQCSGLSAAYTGNTGCPIGYQNNTGNSLTTKDISTRQEFNIDANVLFSGGGRHDLKGGYQYGTTKNDVLSGYAGTGVVQFQYGRDFSYYGVSSSTCTLGTNCVGVGRMIRFGAKGVASNKYQGIFIQDKWTIDSRLTLNLGVRLENENLPAFNTGSGRPGIPLSFGFGKKVAPRLGVAYDPIGDGKTVIRASWGWFYDKLKFELPRGSFGGNFYRIDYFAITTANQAYSYYTPSRILGSWTDPIGGGNPSTAGGLSIFQTDFRIPSNLPASFYTSHGLDPAQVNSDIKPFRQSEFTVGFERELSKEYVFSARYTRKNVDSAIEDHAIIGAYEGEAYYIGNPGTGQDLAADKAAGYAKSAKPQRLYNGLELTLDKRLSHNYFFNVNYTLSHLYGNYSGLASSDEITNGSGRTSPGVNRFFDYIINGYTATGQPDNGDLATDRRHVVKAYGGYNFDWRGSKTNSTEISFFQQVLQGTPQTTFISVVATSIPLSKRGDLGRTPTFYQTDLTLTHKYKFGRDNRFALVADITFLNAFNNNSVLGFNTTKFTQNNTISGTAIDPCYNPDGLLNPGCTTAHALLTPALNAVLNGQIGAQINALQTASNPINVLYGKPNLRQAPRNVRFGFRLIF